MSAPRLQPRKPQGVSSVAPRGALRVCCAALGLSLGCAASPEGVEPAPMVTAPVPDATTPVEPDFTGLNCAEQNPVPAQGRLLTRLQYDNTVRDLFGGVVSGSFAANFPPENQVLGFGTNAEFHRATSWLAEDHMAAAEAIADQALLSLATLLPCSETAADEACAAGFVRDFGTRAFRRPITDAELQSFLQLYRSSAASQGFAYGIELVLRALLQAPQFLYRFEVDSARPLTATLPNLPLSFQLGGYEMAARLSYFLWNSMPDAELFAAAQEDRLQTREQVAEQALRMLQSDLARSTVDDFHRQWLGMERFPALVRSFPDATAAAYNADWRSSLEMFLQDAFWSSAAGDAAGGDVSTLFTSNKVFFNPALAALYGVTLPEGAQPAEFYPIELEPEQRAGLLTQPALMALLAHPDQSAPIQRGVFVREEILCQPAPPPPPSVDPTPPDPDPSLTTRQRFAVHTADDACAGCHRLIDPLGLGFENFDQLGRFRADENGIPVDVSGEVVLTREQAIGGVFNGAAELAERLASSQQVRDCVATQWYRYGSGRVEQNADLCSLAEVTSEFTNSGGNLVQLLVSLVASDAFRYRSESALPSNAPTSNGEGATTP